MNEQLNNSFTSNTCEHAETVHTKHSKAVFTASYTRHMRMTITHWRGGIIFAVDVLRSGLFGLVGGVWWRVDRCHSRVWEHKLYSLKYNYNNNTFVSLKAVEVWNKSNKHCILGHFNATYFDSLSLWIISNNKFIIWVFVTSFISL